jgi:hypothetical protein
MSGRRSTEVERVLFTEERKPGLVHEVRAVRRSKIEHGRTSSYTADHSAQVAAGRATAWTGQQNP